MHDCFFNLQSHIQQHNNSNKVTILQIQRVIDAKKSISDRALISTYTDLIGFN